MKLTVEFASISYREGPEGVQRLARAIEQIGYDHIDIFDHVVMPYPMEGRPPGLYPAQMPILEALILVGYIAAVTSRVTIGTEVLVLPQREPTLVAKQVSTLDTLSGGRIRLGVGVGWQEPEYEALGESFHDRGARMDEAIQLLRAYWSESQVLSLRLAVHAGQDAEIKRELVGRRPEACSYVVGEAEDGFSVARTSEGGEILSFFRMAATCGVGRVL